MKDIVRRLAVSQARGWRQAGFVNDLLAGTPVPYRVVPIPGQFGTSTSKYGVTELDHRSWVGLRNRLYGVGFVFATDRRKQAVTMKFPEGG